MPFECDGCNILSWDVTTHMCFILLVLHCVTIILLSTKPPTYWPEALLPLCVVKAIPLDIQVLLTQCVALPQSHLLGSWRRQVNMCSYSMSFSSFFFNFVFMFHSTSRQHHTAFNGTCDTYHSKHCKRWVFLFHFFLSLTPLTLVDLSLPCLPCSLKRHCYYHVRTFL